MKQQKTFESVWDAIENTPGEALSMKTKSEIMIALRDQIERTNSTQAAVAKKLGITQPRLNDLLRGRINNFSLDALFDLAIRAGIKIQVKLLRINSTATLIMRKSGTVYA